MGQRNTPFAIDEYYHIYSRGVDKRLIFIEESDSIRFKKLLYLCNGSESINYRNFKDKKLSEIDVGEKIVAIGAYCLMPNHFHLLIREIEEGGIVKYMRKLLTSYSAYFNKKYERTGTLFSSNFKAENIDSDEYLKYIYSYIHLNPAKIKNPNWKEDQEIESKAKLIEFIENYPYSSYLNYLNKTIQEDNLILSPQVFPTYFESPENYRDEMWEWLNFKRE